MNKKHEPEPQLDESLQEIAKQFENLSFPARMRKTLYGLSRPKDSGDYKYARLQLQLMAGPIMAIMLPLLGVAFLLSLEQTTKTQTRTQAVEIVENEPIDDIEEPPPEEPPPVEIMEPVDIDMDGVMSDMPTTEVTTNFASNEPLSPKPAEMNSVAITKSPIVMKGIMGSRSPGQRGQALAKYGAQGGEASVMRALRYLKSKQKPDGSMPGMSVSNTALAILTFLAHNETPSPENEEFGPTVEKLIKYICNNQMPNGRFRGHDGNDYSHLIAVYALSEAFSMTKNPLVKEVAEKALRLIVEGQYPSGTWAYNMRFNQGYPLGDVSYAGWAAQAVKAAHTAELEVPGPNGENLLDECYKKAPDGFLLCYDKNRGGFGYNGPQVRGLSGVGALCMQLMGRYDDPAVKKTMELLDECTFSFKDWGKQPWGAGGNGSPIYYWYYITQAKFQEGGSRFKKWNSEFLPELMKMQQVIKAEESGYQDTTGAFRDIGYWDSPSKDEHHVQGGEQESCINYDGKGEPIPNSMTTTASRIQDTCLCALQLMVYYRFLPATLAVNAPQEEKKEISSKDDVKVKVKRRR